jgi:DNA-binding NarL/FixJ family response regulator
MSDAVSKVLIVTDIPESSTETTRMLATASDLQIVGTAATGSDAVALAKLHQPDVVVMDYDMPGLNGAEATRAILQTNPDTQIVMLSVVNDAQDIRTAMRAGARDYLTKPLKQGELVETIRWLLRERRDYARMQAFVTQMRKAYEALFTDDTPVPATVIAFLESQVEKSPGDRLTWETLAVAYARNREWAKLAPLATSLSASAKP